jgi:O-antigen/teichoic acid export membrane protein
VASEPEVGPTRGPHSAPSLKSRAYRAGRWVLIGQFATLVTRLAASLVMTRLLAPEIFGILAITAVALHIVSLLADIGLNQAVVQSPNGENRSFLNTAWTIQIMRGWLIWGGCAALALGLHATSGQGWIPTGSVYAAPTLPVVIIATSFVAVITGFRSIKAISANRDLDLKRITLIEVISQISMLAVAAPLGWATHSIWSYVAGGLFSSLLATVLSHVCLRGPRDRIEWDRNAARELMHFGKWVFLSSALGVLAQNGDRLLLGGWLSAAMLGYYSIAFNLTSIIEGVGGRLFSGVSMPALSDVARRQPERVPLIYFRMRWAADIIFVGTAGFLFASAQWIIGLMFDPRYAPIGPLLQWLSFGLLFARYNLTWAAYVALGKPSYFTPINIAKLIALFFIVPLLYHAFGVQGAIVGIAFHMMPSALLMFWFNRRHGLNNIRLELGALCMWPLGWLVGFTLSAIMNN